MKNIIIIDNNDSFVFNILELLRANSELAITMIVDQQQPLNSSSTIATIHYTAPNSANEQHPTTKRSGQHIAIEFNQLESLLATAHGIVLSPGAGLPSEYPIMSWLMTHNTLSKKPLLGICLGHQAIALASGATLIQMPQPLHGHTSQLTILEPNHPIFSGISQTPTVGRYHSWCVSCNNLPHELQILAIDEDKNIQILRHNTLPRLGMQFHPESIITTQGSTMIDNWIKML